MNHVAFVCQSIKNYTLAFLWAAHMSSFPFLLPCIFCPRKDLREGWRKSVESSLCPLICPYDNFGWGCCNIQMGKCSPFLSPHLFINFSSQMNQSPIFHIPNTIFGTCFSRAHSGIIELTALKETSKYTSKFPKF